VVGRRDVFSLFMSRSLFCTDVPCAVAPAAHNTGAVLTTRRLVGKRSIVGWELVYIRLLRRCVWAEEPYLIFYAIIPPIFGQYASVI
jgi:hypothetical protein